VTGGAGGVSGREATATTEIYDQTTKSWNASAAMRTARYGHTATLLIDGRVLVVGGMRGTADPDASAELYDPTTDIWTPTGSLATGRGGHTATLLADGRVVVVGGIGASGKLASVEVFDPPSGTWTAGRSASANRADHAAALLPGGQILLVGGSDRPSAERYDAATGPTEVGGYFPFEGYTVTAPLQSFEPYLIVGNTVIGLTFAASDGSWANTQPVIETRHHHTATLLARDINTADGMTSRVLVTGGVSVSGQRHLACAELFSRGSWYDMGNMAVARIGHTATLLADGMVLVVGGSDGSTSLDSCELFNPRIPPF
jgi:N-acetylneuraminic acid mutarotase